MGDGWKKAIANSDNNDLRTCALCKKQEWIRDRKTGAINLFKYGVRHYAHIDCLIKRHGRGPVGSQDPRRGVLRKLTWDCLREFPTEKANASGGWGPLLAEVRTERNCSADH